MTRRTLAEKLVSAENEKERYRLLSENKNLADEKLALVLKKICYESWTIEPTKAQKTARAAKSLLKFNANPAIGALSFWVAGIADLTRGRLESAIKNLDSSSEIFQTIGKDHESAQTQVAKIIALALLGKYAEAVRTGEKTIAIFAHYGDELAIGKIENNIGSISIRREDLKNAERSFLSARRRFLKIHNMEELIVSEIGLANTYSAMNDFRKADKFYRKTLENTRKLRMFMRQAEIETNIGSLALYRGKYDEALQFLESSRRKYEDLKMPHQTAIAELEIADAYLELNLAGEAFEIYRRTVPALSHFKIQGETARAHTKFGQAAMLLGDQKTARREFEKAARLYQKEKNPIGSGQINLIEAQLELAENNFETALHLVENAGALFEKSKSQRFVFLANFLKGEILRNLGELEKAERILSETCTGSLRKDQPHIGQICRLALAKIARQKGETAQAKKHYRKAIHLVETLRAPLPAEEFRMAFLADKLVPFENLAKIYLAENDLRRAFLLVEKARARTLSENLDGTFFAQNEGKTSPKLIEKLSKLREELNWFYSRLSRAEANESENLQGEIKRREKKIADVMRQIASMQSARAGAPTKSPESGKIGDFRNLQTTLGSRKALIEFVNFDGALSVFVITDKKIHFVENLARESEIIASLESLQFQFGALRYGAKAVGNFIDELKKRADFYLEKLYEKLIEPLEKFIGEKDLIVVPVGAAYYVPFHALRKSGNYLIETRETAYAPSAKVWRSLMKKRPQNLKSALLMGYADEKIPRVDHEIKTLKKVFPQTKTFTGKAANFGNYIRHAPNFDVLHLACHGQFRADNPLFSSLHLADGFITVKDICSQKLKAELVTLSACETGLNSIFAGDEILGLTRGFLSAGVRSLILSLWTVSDDATAELMKDFYTNLQRGESAAASLKVAQNNFIRRGAHPYFWSPFALIGR
jgi:CHAT domain-containing protein/Tfp pilus assembly protein PilF